MTHHHDFLTARTLANTSDFDSRQSNIVTEHGEAFAGFHNFDETDQEPPNFAGPEHHTTAAALAEAALAGTLAASD